MYLSGTDMPNGVLGGSTAESGALEKAVDPPPPPSGGFMFSADFCLLENVAMERLGLEAFEVGPFSGEKESARVAVEEDFLWEDEEVEVVRREADRRKLEPKSVTEEDKL